MMTSLLEQIESPADLRRLDRSELKGLATELRAFLLESVSHTGGHLSSNLGVVELTLALHYVFHTPEDRLVWDVGHQSYPHKILTGRREAMAGLRQAGGISGFPKRSESPYDAFGTAHSSTSISAALGMAVAARNAGIARQNIAVIGDGAMTAGMAFEALNNAGVIPDINLLVVLNDNDMSISPPVGALNYYFARLMSGRFYARAKNMGKAMLQHVPPVLELARKLEGHAKGMLSPATLFEELGFNYVGPIDGHDLSVLIPTLENLRELGGLQFLHVVTRKGQGYKLAEADPVLYHGPGRFDPLVGIQKPKTPGRKTFSQVFGQWLCDMAQADAHLVGITPAMREGSGLVEFERRFPERYFDVGIAEQHAVTFAAGLACEGCKPVVAIYSTFLQRGYDQLIHDVALQNLDVTFALDRAGIVGADGATHAGNYDIAYLRCIPHMVIATPSDEHEARLLLNTCYLHPGPASVRYPRGAGCGADPGDTLEPVAIGRAVVRRRGKKIAVLVFGTLLAEAAKAAQALDATLVDMRFVKPLDTALLDELLQSHEWFVTLEEAAIMGGAGSAVVEYFNQVAAVCPVLQLGLPDEFIDHGDQKVILSGLGLDAQGIEASIRERLNRTIS
ncbi:MAG TPA: 1-deoxy-D-xylulose-5-phosphate synthase [Castellaniella sp.]|uniref:1-deoxy-D-xylulose-5-phosphate synthase n=1 Tax=Castellaniella sp. TaxID=1955812 RepID=UPI002F01557D